jgi:signal transduction histidine kinase
MQVLLRLYSLLILLLPATFLRAQDHGHILSTKVTATDSARIFNNIRSAEKLIDINPDSATVILKTCLQESKTAWLNEGIMRSLLALSTSARKKQDYTLSEAWLNEANAFFFSSGVDSSLYIRMLNNFGLICNDKGQYEEAAKYFYKAIAMCNTRKDSPYISLLVTSYINLSGLFLRNNDTAQAMHYIDLAQNIAIKNKDTTALISVLLNKGVAFFLAEDTVKAHSNLEKALSLSLQTGNINMQVKIYNNTGILLQKEQKNKEAMLCFKKAIDLSDSLSNGYDYILSSANMGYSAFLLKDYPRSEYYLLQAIRLSERSGLKSGVIAAYAYLAQLYKQTGRLSLAYQYQEKYIKLLEEHYDKEKVKTIRELEIKYQTAINAKELSDKKLQVAKQQRHIEKQRNLIGITVSASLFIVGFLALLFILKNRLNKARILQLKKEEQIHSLTSLMAGEEQERKRIAEELHDGIGGMLAALKMNFSSLQEKYSLDQEQPFIEVMSMLDDTCKEVRRTSHNLMPDILIRHRLGEAIKRYVSQIMDTKQIEIDLQLMGNLSFENRSFELALYRILQELIQNILKHAEASHALVQISRNNNMLSLLVEDNGIGYEPAAEPKGIGMENVRNRVQSFGGSIEIQSGAGKGMMIHMEFDLDNLKNNLA